MLDNAKKEFLVHEMKISLGEAELLIRSREQKKQIVALCAGIIEEEVEKEEQNASDFNVKRLNMAEFTAAILMDALWEEE
jgi:hypothetical protein